MPYSLYVASSWRNERQPAIVEQLRGAGFEVYDFRHPEPGNEGFAWREIDPDWESWTPARFRELLDHPTACHGFVLDFGAMVRAHAGVLVLPCGRSAHLEAGYFIGANKPLHILLSEGEPELMYKMASGLHLDVDELVEALLSDAAEHSAPADFVEAPALRARQLLLAERGRVLELLETAMVHHAERGERMDGPYILGLIDRLASLTRTLAIDEIAHRGITAWSGEV